VVAVAVAGITFRLLVTAVLEAHIPLVDRPLHMQVVVVVVNIQLVTAPVEQVEAGQVKQMQELMVHPIPVAVVAVLIAAQQGGREVPV
jgi:translation elongation factor EF-1alpha